MKLIINILLILLKLSEIYAHNHTAYSHDDVSNIDNSKWMSDIDDETLLSHISLPGTHETMALYGGDLLQCQTLSLEDQMRAGIRVFDIRCRNYYNTFTIHHDIVYQKTNFSNVLDAMVQFLEQNPSEVFLMRVKEEYESEGSTQTFEETFVDYRTDIYYNDYIWEPTGLNPKLGDVRGQIIILQNFGASKLYGLDYNTLNIQDYYALKSNWDLYNKWEKVKAQIVNANSSRDGFYMNYLSGSSGSLCDSPIPICDIPLVVFPFFVASGHIIPSTCAPRLLTGRTTVSDKNIYPDFPRVLCTSIFNICKIAFEGTNILTYDYIQSFELEFVGIIMIDFPGDGLIKAIIELNFN